MLSLALLTTRTWLYLTEFCLQMLMTVQLKKQMLTNPHESLGNCAESFEASVKWRIRRINSVLYQRLTYNTLHLLYIHYTNTSQNTFSANASSPSFLIFHGLIFYLFSIFPACLISPPFALINCLVVNSYNKTEDWRSKNELVCCAVILAPCLCRSVVSQLDSLVHSAAAYTQHKTTESTETDIKYLPLKFSSVHELTTFCITFIHMNTLTNLSSHINHKSVLQPNRAATRFIKKQLMTTHLYNSCYCSLILSNLLATTNYWFFII